jgi:hypothetical protein
MNPFDPHPEPEPGAAASWAWIDRLVEGDLDEAGRRAALLRLEAEPDGWRRCALAFLEAQAWREALGEVARSAWEPATAAGPALAPPARPPRPRRLRLAASWAAGLAAAFALGWASGGSARTESGREVALAPTGPPKQRPGAEAEAPPPPQLARVDTAPEPPGPPRVPDPAPSGPAPDGPPTIPGPARAASPPGAVPEYVLGQLRRRGYRVEQERGVLIGVRGGRRVAVPVEQVKIRYVGRGTS